MSNLHSTSFSGRSSSFVYLVLAPHVLVKVLVADGAFLFENPIGGILVCEPSTMNTNVGDNDPTIQSLAKSNHEDSLLSSAQ